MRQRLGDGEATSRRGQLRSEEHEGELVAGPWLNVERVGRSVEAIAVVLLELARTARRIVDGIAVPRERDLGIELDRAVERGQVVAERVRPARRPEADGRRDAPEEVIGGNEDPVPEQAQLAVGVARRGDELPTVHVLARLDEDGIALIADERPVDRALPDELGRDAAGAPLEPGPV